MESASQTAIYECPDSNASTIAVDADGKYAIVGGRKCIYLINLDANDEVAKDTTSDVNTIVQSNLEKNQSAIQKFARNTKWDPTSSHFNKSIKNLYALTSYRNVEIFSINELNPSKPKFVLRGHSRYITDIEWSNFDSHVIGSSSADCLTNLWDIRDHRRPTAALSSVCAATHIRFSKTVPNIVATSHEIDVRIWDLRQPSQPLHYIAAHLQKINGMDWNPNKTEAEQELTTCSQDNTIKQWNLVSHKIKPSANVSTKSSIWRVRYAPIQQTVLLTSTLPQLKYRDECSTLNLWSLKTNRYGKIKSDLMLSLIGHTDVVVDFDWRPRAVGSLDCELLSWSKDQTVRVWSINHQLIEMFAENSDYEADCDPIDSLKSPVHNIINNNENDEPRDLSSNESFESQILKDIDDNEQDIGEKIPLKSAQPENVGTNQSLGESDDLDSDLASQELRQEFSLINRNIPNIEFEELNFLRRVCLVTARFKNLSCRLRIALPPAYPQTECPTFTIIDSANFGSDCLSKESKENLMSMLDETAKSQLSRSRNCLEPCLRKFVATLQKIAGNSASRIKSSASGSDMRDDPITISAQRDHSVPFPRTSGARFSGNLLIVFGRPVYYSDLLSNTSSSVPSNTNWLVETPRSMAQMSAQLDNMRRQGAYNLSNISISYFYYGALHRAELQNRSKLASSRQLKYLAMRSKAGLPLLPRISTNLKSGHVLILDASKIQGSVSKYLAINYVFDKEVIEMCKRNTEIANFHGRKDLVQIWSLAQLSSEGMLHSHCINSDNINKTKNSYQRDLGGYQDNVLSERPWTMHPFGGKLIQSLIDHFVINCYDYQTAAMLVWAFSSPKLEQTVIDDRPIYANSNEQLGINNLVSNNIDESESDQRIWNSPEIGTLKDSAQIKRNVLSSSLPQSQLCATDKEFDQYLRFNILGEKNSLHNDFIMHVYADMLYRLNLLNQRALVLKNIGSHSSYKEIFGETKAWQDKLSNVRVVCQKDNCSNECNSVKCLKCKDYCLYCSICRLPVKGTVSACVKCLHGGHINHYNSWFEDNDLCPTGCGCKCVS